jgi:hypothetical protein
MGELARPDHAGMRTFVVLMTPSNELVSEGASVGQPTEPCLERRICRSEAQQNGLLLDDVEDCERGLGVASKGVGKDVRHPLLKPL